MDEANRAVAAYVHEFLRENGTDAAGQVGLSIHGGQLPSVDAIASAVDHVVLVTVDLAADGAVDWVADRAAERAAVRDAARTYSVGSAAGRQG